MDTIYWIAAKDNDETKDKADEIKGNGDSEGGNGPASVAIDTTLLVGSDQRSGEAFGTRT